MKTILLLSATCLLLSTGCKPHESFAGEWQAICESNQKQLESAKEQWALEQKKRTGDTPTEADLSGLMKKYPTCPAGGTYLLNPIGTDATCTVHHSKL